MPARIIELLSNVALPVELVSWQMESTNWETEVSPAGSSLAHSTLPWTTLFNGATLLPITLGGSGREKM